MASHVDTCRLTTRPPGVVGPDDGYVWVRAMRPSFGVAATSAAPGLIEVWRCRTDACQKAHSRLHHTVNWPSLPPWRLGHLWLLHRLPE